MHGPLKDTELECVPPLCLLSQKLSQHLVCMRKSSPSTLCFCATILCKSRELNVPANFCSDNVIAILLELNWKLVTATHWINDLDDTWTFDLSKTFDVVPVVSDIERASMRILWKAASLHRHGESLATDALDLTVLRRHLQSLQKRGLLERAAVLQLAACGGLWPEQRCHEAFLQDRADDAEIETEEHRFYCCKGNNTGDPDLVDLVAKTDWIVLKARVGLT